MRPDASSPVDSSAAPLQGHLVRRSRHDEVGQMTSLWSQVLALALLSVSLLVYAVVAADGTFGTAFYGWLAGQLTVMLVAAFLLRRQAMRSGREVIVSPLLVVAALTALVWEWISRTFLAAGAPFELVTMSAVRNLVFGLAIVSVWPVQQRLAIVLSLFLTIFGVTASHDISTHWLAALFTVGAVNWLIVSHWENVQRRLKGTERSHWPRWVLAVPLVMLFLVGVGAASADRKVLKVLGGFLPSSGGTGDSDPYARDGVGDGEMLVAGTEQIQSFAPIEDAPFMQDDQPSLYDLFDDTYQEEFQIMNTDRAIALPPELSKRAREHVHNQTEKANREFSTLRQPTDDSQRRRASDIRSDAVLYVAGRVPLHLRLQIYDLFDGVTWYPEEPHRCQPLMEFRPSGGKSWLRLNDRGKSREFLGTAETHALKIVRFDSNVIPAPLYLHGIHIDLVDRGDMFSPGPDGLVAMRRKTLPSLVPIHLASRSVDWEILDDDPKLFLRVPSEHAVSVVPSSIDSDELRRLADQWSHGAAEGWEQVAAIVERLRSEYVLDPDWRPDPSGRTGVEQFLFESRRGPDYQFATAIALLLRSQGHATRVVSGFYADPGKYDSDSRHTPVLPDDVHFWAEVRVSGGDWITLEASPGYEMLGPPPGWLQRAWSAVVAFAVFIASHWLASLATLASGLLAWWKRREIAGCLYLIRWKWSAWWAPNDAVRLTLDLLRRRSGLTGSRPQNSTTHHRWLSELIIRGSDQRQAQLLDAFRHEIDAAAYSLHRERPLASTADLCRDVVNTCTLEWFRSQVSVGGNPGTCKQDSGNSIAMVSEEVILQSMNAEFVRN